MEDIENWIKNIETAIDMAENEKSKLTKDVLQLEGMSSPKIRHFLNNLCASTDPCNYLEIGTWKGSTLVSALFNNFHCHAIGNDNWSKFGGPQKDCKKNIDSYLKNIDVKFISGDCWKIDLSKYENFFNVYLYDAAHDEESQKKALTCMLPYLQDNFILLVDDYGWPEVKSGTQQGIDETKIKVIKSWEMPGSGNSKKTWWNGFLIAACSKVK